MTTTERSSPAADSDQQPLLSPPVTALLFNVLELMVAWQRPAYPLEVAHACDERASSTNTVMRRLADKYGWLEAKPENVDPVEAGRPTRLYYTLTGTGLTGARKILSGRDPRPNIPLLLARGSRPGGQKSRAGHPINNHCKEKS